MENSEAMCVKNFNSRCMVLFGSLITRIGYILLSKVLKELFWHKQLAWIEVGVVDRVKTLGILDRNLRLCSVVSDLN